ncbi:MAG TPA: Kdo hydroxylase family protein [Thermoanaerobaculia bacterium]
MLKTCSAASVAAGDELAAEFESGSILFFPEPPFEIPSRDLLNRLDPGEARFHKNIAYRPSSGRLTGVSGIPRPDRGPLHSALAKYSDGAITFLSRLFPRYARAWRIDYTSFRPFEEEGRALSPKARNDLVHVDSFPSRPTRGDRILRFFTNVHREKPRVWITGGTFDRLAERYAVSSGILAAVTSMPPPGVAARTLAALGLRKGVRSRYDEFMLRFHDYLKENAEVQAAARKEPFSFPPGSFWIVYTDTVSHGVLSGQSALEQTVIVSRDSLAVPEKAPISILERLAGRPLA